VPSPTRLTRLLAIAVAVAFAAFVAAKGIPTLRHDWNWPIDRLAEPSFLSDSIEGWLSTGFGTPNAHPTTYLIALPLGLTMWLFGPLAALVVLAAAIGFLCMRSAAAATSHWGSAAPAAAGIGLFALFNPWVYNEVVAGHLVMVLAYGGLIGMSAEMLCGRRASSVRLALWVALIAAQLQFFIIAMIALTAFAIGTRKWLPVAAGVLVALPSIVGLIAEGATLEHIPYGMEWQTNQSVAPFALLGLGGYFPGYADRLGIVASVATWIMLALALGGAVVMRRSRAMIWMLAVAVFVYVVALGVHGPFAAAYAWTVRNVPESGVFRELYDLGGIFAVLVALLASAAAARLRIVGYVALAAGIALPLTWLVHPPSDLWIGSTSYPHPAVPAPPFTRIALLPAFQPLGLISGGGDGADPDAHAYPDRVSTLNEYLPTYPVDMALARYEQSGDVGALRGLGVVDVVNRPWMVSRTRGGVGLAASSLAPKPPRFVPPPVLSISDAVPLISECDGSQTVAFSEKVGPCDIFFGDTEGYAPVRTIVAPTDSIHPRTAWIDARLAFAEMPALAQGLGGALTQSNIPFGVESGWLLAYVRGELDANGHRTLMRSNGAFRWLPIPNTITSVQCVGLCELVAQTSNVPWLTYRMYSKLPFSERTRALEFRELRPWFYIVRRETESAALLNRVLRLNERYDPGWIAIEAGRILPHVRVDLAVNGWLLGDATENVILVQAVALLQLIAEVIGILCVIYLLKALARAPTKRAR
jgi:hypothetical protein